MGSGKADDLGGDEAMDCIIDFGDVCGVLTSLSYHPTREMEGSLCPVQRLE